MTPEEIVQQAQAMAQGVRAVMGQVPTLSPMAAVLVELASSDTLHRELTRQYGSNILTLADALAEQQAAATEQAEKTKQEQVADMLSHRPPDGIIKHEPPAPGQSAKEKAEAAQAERERLLTEVATLEAEQSTLAAERDALEAERKALEAELAAREAAAQQASEQESADRWAGLESAEAAQAKIDGRNTEAAESEQNTPMSAVNTTLDLPED